MEQGEQGHHDDAGRRDAHGRFRPGHSGNPKGKPPGTRHSTTILARAMREGETDIVRHTFRDWFKADLHVVDARTGGDITAQVLTQIILELDTRAFADGIERKLRGAVGSVER